MCVKTLQGIPAGARPDVICIQESRKVTDETARTLGNDLGYQVFCQVRDDGQGGSSGGGVAILISNAFDCRRVPLESPATPQPLTQGEEVVVADVWDRRDGGSRLRVASVYIPPKTGNAMKTLDLLHHNKVDIIGTDANARVADWEPPRPRREQMSEAHRRGVDLRQAMHTYGYHGAHEHVNVPVPTTRLGTTVDYILMAADIAPVQALVMPMVGERAGQQMEYDHHMVTLYTDATDRWEARRVQPILWHLHVHG
jgi:hypothetical protein